IPEKRPTALHYWDAEEPAQTLRTTVADAGLACHPRRVGSQTVRVPGRRYGDIHPLSQPRSSRERKGHARTIRGTNRRGLEDDCRQLRQEAPNGGEDCRTRRTIAGEEHSRRRAFQGPSACEPEGRTDHLGKG